MSLIIATTPALSKAFWIFTLWVSFRNDLFHHFLLLFKNKTALFQFLTAESRIIELPIIQNKNRRSEQELKKAFQQEHPKILGSLLTIFSRALKILSGITLSEKPRMADFVLLGTALEQALNWERGSFLKEYLDNHQENILCALDGSAIMLALTKLLDKRNHFYGTFGDLFRLLNSPEYKSTLVTGWPTSPKGLSNILKRQAAALELIGIKCNFSTSRHKRGYSIDIKREET